MGGTRYQHEDAAVGRWGWPAWLWLRELAQADPTAPPSRCRPASHPHLSGLSRSWILMSSGTITSSQHLEKPRGCRTRPSLSLPSAFLILQSPPCWQKAGAKQVTLGIGVEEFGS